MGEAKLKSKKSQQFIKQHPYCCFCGGTTFTETIDHVPSKQIFRLKQRPKGLEFPACKICNELSGPHELVAALLSRVLSFKQMSILEKRELQKLFRAVDRSRHGLLKELWPTWQQQYDYNHLNHPDKPRGGGPLNAGGPMLNQSIQLFGAKMCLALHYEHKKVIVPPSGGVMIRWYSNWDRITNNIPDVIFELFQKNVTLVQGKWDVKDQFSYSYAFPENSDMSAFFCTFRKSFAFVGFIRHDINKFPDWNSIIHIPGRFYDSV